MTKTTATVIGIDVSKAWLDVGVHEEGLVRRFDNDAAGLGALEDWLAGMAVSLVVMEATGRLHRLCEARLLALGLAVAVVNPAHVRHFARAKGRLAKTDRADALMIAAYGAAMRPAPRLARPPELLALADLVARRRQLVDTLAAEKNRLNSLDDAALSRPLRDSFEAVMLALVGAITAMERSIDDAIHATAALSRKDQALRSVPGVGPVLSQTLIAEMPELGSLTRRQAAALAGLAPVARDSGRLRGRRFIQGGRANLRPVLYMATIAAIRCNPRIAAFYNRLLDAGKNKKAAITACMRKLIVTLNAILRDNNQWTNA